MPTLETEEGGLVLRNSERAVEAGAGLAQRGRQQPAGADGGGGGRHPAVADRRGGGGERAAAEQGRAAGGGSAGRAGAAVVAGTREGADLGVPRHAGARTLT